MDLIDSLICGNYKITQDKLLIEKVNPNAVDDWFNATPLHYAVLYKRANIMPLLICAGADRKAQDGDGCTPLDLAVELNHSKEASVLLWPDEIFVVLRIFMNVLVNSDSFLIAWVWLEGLIRIFLTK